MPGDKSRAGQVAPVFGFKIDGISSSPPSREQEQQRENSMQGARSPTLVIIPPAFQNQPGSLAAASKIAPIPPEAEADAATSEESHSFSLREGGVGDASTPKPIRQTAESERRRAAHREEELDGEESDEASEASFTTMSELQMSMVGGPTLDPVPAPRSPKNKSPLSLQKSPVSKGGPETPEPPAAPAVVVGKVKSSGGADVDQATTSTTTPSQPSFGADKKKPELTKAERRAIQEAQRAAKSAGLPKGSQPPPTGKAAPPPPAPASAPKAQETKSSAKVGSLPRNNSNDTFRSDSSIPPHTPMEGSQGGAPGPEPTPGPLRSKPPKKPVPSFASTELFSHLPQYKSVSVASILAAHSSSKGLHPAVLQLGLKLADGTVSGANARCMAMLHTLCQVIQDYSTPAGKSLSRDLTQQINSIINFLVDCRPLAVSMGNAIKHLKLRLSKIDPSQPEAEAKHALISSIADFVNARIRLADQEIISMTVKKVVDGDVVMTYAYSHVVCSALLEAATFGQTRFKVLVVDSRPEQEGKLMMQKLLEAGLSVSYVHINAISYAIREATKVFLGAAAIMHNGTVVSRAGTAAVAMVAHEHRKPVLVLCESYKFHERVQLDSITHNELGDPEALATVCGRPDVKALVQPKTSSSAVSDADSLSSSLTSSLTSSLKRPCLLNLKYDAMPAEYVTTIVCEFGMIPPTSVPVILRECNKLE